MKRDFWKRAHPTKTKVFAPPPALPRLPRSRTHARHATVPRAARARRPPSPSPPAAPPNARRRRRRRVAPPPSDARAASLADYAALKRRVGANARRTGGALALYLFLTVSADAAAASLVGTAAGSLYLAWLARDVEAINVDTRVPVMAARAVEAPALRNVALAVAGLVTGLTPRLLVYVALGAAYGGWNATHAADAQLPLLVAGAAALGFGSYKGALLWELYECYRPRVDPDVGLRQERPVLDLPEVETYRPGREKEEEKV